MSQDAVDALVELLDLEPIEVNIFRGVSPDEDRQRVFGGQVAGQALVAAARTVEPGRSVHSLHAYFLRPGDVRVPILYEVDRIRDGRSFTTRRVVAIQHGKAIFNLQSSFQVPEDGLEFEAPMPEVPDPETLPDFTTRMAPYAEKMGPWYTGRGRSTCATSTSPRPTSRARARRSSRCGSAPTARSPTIRCCTRACVTYASDMTLLDTAVRPHGRVWGDEGLMMASIDHAMWFHRPFRADDWLLYDQDTPSSSGSRGLGRGNLFTRDGHLAVTVVQEGLIRVLRG